jgi:hypothetical protein
MGELEGAAVYVLLVDSLVVGVFSTDYKARDFFYTRYWGSCEVIRTILDPVEPFHVGDIVTPSSPRSSLVMGESYVVERYISPHYIGGEAVVFVKGHTYGLNPEHFRLKGEEL